MNGRLNRIAGRIFTAFTCRKRVYEHGFGYDGADSGIIAFNYNFYVLFWCYPKNGQVKFVYAKKDSDAFDALYWDVQNAKGVGKEIKDVFNAKPHGRNVRNFRILLWNNIAENKGLVDFDGHKDAFLVDSTKTMDLESARELLTTKWNISMTDFRRVFGGEADESLKFSCCNMDFEVNGTSMGQEEIERKMRDVESKLPAGLAQELLYGKVELKKEFPDATIADYAPGMDEIRIDESDNFVHAMIHELGHRWHYRFCTKTQEAQLMQLYHKCKNPGQIQGLKAGDVITMRNSGDNQYEIVEIGYRSVKLKVLKSNHLATGADAWILKSKCSPRYISAVNGVEVALEYELPREYAGKNIKEFIASCFEYAYAGLPMQNALKEDFMKIVES